MAVVWFTNVVVLLRLTYGRGDEEREVAFLQLEEMTAPLDALVKNVGLLCVRRFTSDNMVYSGSDKELKHGLVKVGE